MTHFHLQLFPLPYGNIPPGFEYPPGPVSEISATEAFKTGIKTRDSEACVVCGFSISTALEHAHIIPQVEEKTWNDLKTRGWIPPVAKGVQHESRNGLLLCSNHHKMFDCLHYYIRWEPQLRQYIFVNHGQYPDLEAYHGKAISLKPDDTRAPLRSIFLIHEARVRGYHPFMGDRPLPSPIMDQVWMRPPATNLLLPNQALPGQLGGPSQLPASPVGASNAPQGDPTQQGGTGLRYSVGKVEGPGWIMFTNPFADLAKLDEHVKSFQDAPNWKAAVIEGGGWDGTAEENTARYMSSVKVEPTL